MNPEDFSREDLLPDLSPVLAAAGCLVALFLWLARLRAAGRIPRFGLGWHVVGFALVAVGLWLGIQFLGNFVSFATSWPLWTIALGGGIAAEIIVAVYRFEKSLVHPTRGRILLGLRLAALLVLLLILTQPVLSFLESREIEREIAILVDESDSMLLADQRLSPGEILDRAELFGHRSAGKRPAFRRIAHVAEELDERIELEVASLSAAPNLLSGLDARDEQLPDFFDRVVAEKSSLAALIENLDAATLPGEVRSRVDDYRKRTRDGVTRTLDAARGAAESGDAEDLVRQLELAREELAGILETISATGAKADDNYYRQLGEDVRREIEQVAARPRIEIARRVLEFPVPTPDEDDLDSDIAAENSGDEASTRRPLWNALAENYNLRLYQFARDIDQVESPAAGEWSGEIGTSPRRALTDLTGALESVLENTAPESLAGLLLLSDGRHNGGIIPEDGLRQLAVQNSPLSAVPIGGRNGPVDISLLDLQAPESIYLDDRVVVTADAKLDGFLGETITAELLSDGETVDTVDIEVTDVSFRTEIRFVHRPEDKGILDYRIRLDPDEREIFDSNNEWDFKVAVTDDRTNVLLVDSYPRWEFRYLRNLFYGRDKSVHLQYVLLHPDEIHRSPDRPVIAPSATRAFGDAEATTLPRSPEEWRLFDVIILGDVSPSALSNGDWLAIREAVTKRGALLVCVAGARHMPHGIDSDTLRDLLPVAYEPSNAVRFDSPEPAYHVELTTAGQSHAVTSQSTSRALNQERWSGFQPMTWRFLPESVKETAEVLAYARPVGTSAVYEATEPDGSPGSVEAALERLANRKELERSNALISTIRSGLGKVLLLNFDQTWRFRYGVGDTYHHRFWGQVTRWGAGDNLRSGNEFIRLGTDRLTYTPNDSVEVTAKLLDEERRPIMDADVEVEIWKDDERIGRQKLGYRSDSSGIYETSLDRLRGEGGYELRLVGDAVDGNLSESGDEAIATELLVATVRNPVELAELTADREFLNRATTMTGGTVADLGEIENLLDSFGAPKETLTERRNVTLWDTWPLLVAFLGFLTTEWILRRRSGLV